MSNLQTVIQINFQKVVRHRHSIYLPFNKYSINQHRDHIISSYIERVETLVLMFDVITVFKI